MALCKGVKNEGICVQGEGCCKGEVLMSVFKWEGMLLGWEFKYRCLRGKIA